MVENIIKIQKNIEETRLNPEAKVESYISAELDDQVSNSGGGLSVSISAGKKTLSSGTVAENEESGYLANSTALRGVDALLGFLKSSQVPIYNYTVEQNYKQYFSAAEITTLQTQANNGEWNNVRNLLHKRLDDYQSVIAEYNKLLEKNPGLAGGAMKAEMAKIKSAAAALKNLVKATNEQVSTMLFSRAIVGYQDPTTIATTTPGVTTGGDVKTTSVQEAFEAMFGPLSAPAPDSDLSTLINYQILSGVYSLLSDDDYYSAYYADRVQDKYNDFFNAFEKSHLEQLANEGKWDELKEYLSDLTDTYQKMVDEYDELIAHYPDLAGGTLSAQIAKIRGLIIPGLQELAALGQADLEKKLFEKVKTEFLIPEVEKLDQVKTQILFYANLEKLLTMLGQAKIDAYNTVKQVLDNQTGYEKMNLRKLNSKRGESLANYVNTRKKEIYDYVNNYNERVKAEIEQEIRDAQEDSEGNFFVRAGLGVISFLAGLVASIFSLGLVAPLVLSSISTTYEVFNTNRQAEDDIKLRQQLQKLEEELALLKATESRLERELAERKLENIREQRKISKLDFMNDTGITEAQWEQLVALGYLDENGYVQEKLYKDPQAFAAAAAAFLGVNLTAVQNYLASYLNSGNLNYHNLLDIEALLNSSLCDLELIERTSGGYYQFSNQNYLAAYMRTQTVASAFRLYQSLVKARMKGRNIVAEELGVGKISEGEYSDAVFKNNLEDVFKKLSKLAELQFAKAQALNRQRELRAEIANLQLSSWYKVLGSIFFQSIDLATFGTSSLFLRDLLTPLGRSVFDLFTKYETDKKNSYSDVAPQELAGNGLVEDIYSEILGGTTYSELTVAVGAGQKSVNYDAYLEKLRQLEIMNILNNIYLSIYSAGVSSRTLVHQALTGNSGYKAATDVAAESYQQQNDLTKDILQKQLQMAASAVQSNNQKVAAELELNRSGYRVLTSMLSGLVSGYSKTSNELTDKLLGNMLSYVLENNSDDILDLALTHSDFYLNPNSAHYSFADGLGDGQVGVELQDVLNSDLFVADGRGQTVLDSSALARKMFAVYQAANVNQVIAALAEAKQKARQMIMSVVSEQPGAEASGTARRQAEITTAGIQDKLDAISQKLMGIVDLLTRRNLRLNQAQRNIFTSAVQAGLGSLLLGRYPDREYAGSLTGLAKIFISTGFTVRDLSDDIAKKALLVRQGIVAENTTTVNETLLLGKIEAAELELLIQAMQLKQNIGLYGLGGVNTAALQYISILQRKLQLFKQKILEISQSLQEGVSVVHASLESQVIDLSGLAGEILNNNKQFLQGLIAEIKKQKSKLAEQSSRRVDKLLEGVTTVTDGVLKASDGLSGFLTGAPAQANMLAVNYYISQLKDSLNGLIKVGLERTSSGHATKLSGLTELQAGEVQEILAAEAADEVQLQSQAIGILRNVNETLNAGSSGVSVLLNSNVNKQKLLEKIKENLLDQRLRQLRVEQKQLSSIRSVELQSAEKTYQYECAQVMTALEQFYFNYEEMSKESEKISPLLQKYSDPLRQEELNANLQQALGSGEGSILSENLADYLGLSEIGARRVEKLLSKEQASDLRTLYDFVKLYRRICQDSILLAKVQQRNRQAFNEYLIEYNRQYYAINGSFAPEFLAFMLSDYFYSSYLAQERNMGEMLGKFDEINQALKGRMSDKTKGVAAEENDPYAMAVNMALNKSIYDGLGGGKELSEAEREEAKEYYDQQWRLFGNILKTQRETGLRSGQLKDGWNKYFEKLTKEKQSGKPTDLDQRYQRASSDLRNIEKLFAGRGIAERIDINIEDVSQEAKGYIMQLVGNNVVYNQQCRELILNYLSRKLENLEIQIIQRDTDEKFAYDLLQKEMEDLTALQDNYNDAWLTYEEAFRLNDTKLSNDSLTKLNKLKAEIEEAELKFKRKRERYGQRLQRELFPF